MWSVYRRWLLAHGANLGASSSLQNVADCWQQDKWKVFLNAPQLNFSEGAQVCPLIFTHNFNWPATEGKYTGRTETIILPSVRNIHSVSLREKWIAVFNNILRPCMHPSTPKSLSDSTFTISRELFVSRFLNDFQVNVKSRQRLSFPKLCSSFRSQWYQNLIYFITLFIWLSFKLFRISTPFSQLPGIASFILFSFL